MNWERVEDFLCSGQAFIPVNAKDKGDSTQILMRDGTIEHVDLQSAALLSQLLSYFATSIVANRNRYGQLVGKKQLVPIVLSYGITLIPYNVREPVGHQSRIGWFLAKDILTFCKQSSNETLIYLAKHRVSVMHSEKFCFEQVKNARCIEMCYGEIHEPYRKNWLFTAG